MLINSNQNSPIIYSLNPEYREAQPPNLRTVSGATNHCFSYINPKSVNQKFHTYQSARSGLLEHHSIIKISDTTIKDPVSGLELFYTFLKNRQHQSRSIRNQIELRIRVHSIINHKN